MTDEAPSTRPKPFVFVLMPFDHKFDDIYKFGIQGAAADVGAYAERVDEQLFTEGMLDRIFTQISKADVIIADMTGRNPNVFYEVGYAHALDKIALLLTQDSNDIPFDLKHRQHTVYGGKIDLLRTELAKRLQWAIAESRRRLDRASAEFISVQVFGRLIPGGIQNDDPPAISGSVPRADEIFAIPVQLRNDAADTLKEISHVYLFTEDKPVIVPGRVESEANFFYSFGSPSEAKKKPTAKPLDSFTANPMDAPDGLTRQYRLPISFPALPPGAIEVSHLSLMFAKGKTSCDAVYRLRLHTQTRFYDYRFRLNISVAKQKDAADV
jgi:hypothetical protein